MTVASEKHCQAGAGTELVWALILRRAYKVSVEMSVGRVSHPQDHRSFYSPLGLQGAKWRPRSFSYQELSDGKVADGEPQSGPKGRPRLGPQNSRNPGWRAVTG